ncbi:MAG: hypothetical protein J6W35_08305 [Eubacterium sp.]|nr:hypothetical protein [Eubacterium sp.]
MQKYKIYEETAGGAFKFERGTKSTIDEAIDFVVNENKYAIMYDKMDEAMFDIEINDKMVKAADTEKNQAVINGWLKEKKTELLEKVNSLCMKNFVFNCGNHWTITATEEYYLYQNGKLGMSGPFDELFRYIHDYCPYESAAREFLNIHVDGMLDFLWGEIGNLLIPDDDCPTDFSANIFNYIRNKLKYIVDGNGSAIFAGVVISAEPVENLFER